MFEVGTDFCPLQKLDSSHVLFSRIFILEKGLWMPQSEIARPKISKRSVFDTLQKLGTEKFVVLAIQFCARETACGPKKVLFLGWMNLGSWVYVGFLSS